MDPRQDNAGGEFQQQGRGVSPQDGAMRRQHCTQRDQCGQHSYNGGHRPAQHQAQTEQKVEKDLQFERPAGHNNRVIVMAAAHVRHKQQRQDQVA